MTDEQKYATLNEVKHYETTEVRDEYQRIILNKGMIVDKDISNENVIFHRFKEKIILK